MSNTSLGGPERRDAHCGRWLCRCVTSRLVFEVSQIYIYMYICGHCISCSALANRSHAKSSLKYLNLSIASNIVNTQLVIMTLIMKKNSNINSLFDSADVWFVWTVFVERKKQTDDATWRSKSHLFSILLNINWLNYINDNDNRECHAPPPQSTLLYQEALWFPRLKKQTKRRHSADSLSSCASYYMHYTMHSDVELEKCKTEIGLRVKPAREAPQTYPTGGSFT